MGPRSQRLVGPVRIPLTGLNPAFTCPSDKVALLKSIRVVLVGGTVAPAAIGIGALDFYNVVGIWTPAVFAQAVDDDTDPVVLEPDEVLWAALGFGADETTAAVLTISGALLQA